MITSKISVKPLGGIITGAWDNRLNAGANCCKDVPVRHFLEGEAKEVLLSLSLSLLEPIHVALIGLSRGNHFRQPLSVTTTFGDSHFQPWYFTQSSKINCAKVNNIMEKSPKWCSYDCFDQYSFHNIDRISRTSMLLTIDITKYHIFQSRASNLRRSN